MPAACLLLQGGLEIHVDSDSIVYGPGQSVIMGGDSPVLARVSEASAEAPFRALFVSLDVPVLRRMQAQVGHTRFDRLVRPSSESRLAPTKLVQAFARYFDLLRNPIDARIMSPLVNQELHYRVLQAHHNLILKRLLTPDGRANKIALALAYLRKHFRESVPVEELARTAGMGLTSFHTHFREVTRTTPHQYQKELRLIEARRLLIEQGLPVSVVAYRIGYKSPTQFSREYSKKYGEPPSKHVSEEMRSA